MYFMCFWEQIVGVMLFCPMWEINDVVLHCMCFQLDNILKLACMKKSKIIILMIIYLQNASK